MKKTIFNLFTLILVSTALLLASYTVYGEEATPSSIQTVFADDFSSGDGAKWNLALAGSSTITFADGTAAVRGGGPENRLSTKSIIGAGNFTIDFDLWLNAGNTNCAVKFVFKSDDTFKNRYQVTYDDVNNALHLEKVTGGTATKLQSATGVDLPVNTGASAHHFTIIVTEDAVQVLINGEEKLSASAAGLSAAAPGYFAIASQFPAQDYNVDNVSITAEQSAPQYAVTLKTMTNNVIDTQPDSAGGTLAADKLSGTDGEIVSLTPTANEGYEFVGYASFLTDTGGSTDGLLTISNNQFPLSDKTGNVTIVAKFETIKLDPNQVFLDRFSGTLNQNGQYSEIKTPAGALIQDGALVLSSDGGTNYLIANKSSWNIAEPMGEGYRIALDVSKANATPGTLQIAFRVGSFSDRYVLALNGAKALIRRFDASGGNYELASELYTLDSTPRQIVITVLGNTVSVTSNDVPVISYQNQSSTGDTEGWTGVPYGLALINMTSGAPVVYDNVSVTKFTTKSPIRVRVTNNHQPDETYASGVAQADPAAAAPGQEVTLTALPKAGFRLEGFYLDSSEKLQGNSFIVPVGAGEQEIVVTANFVRDETIRAAAEFYIDAVSGNDTNSGTSLTTPWKTLAKLSTQPLVPGDKIYIKAGSRFSGADALLTLNGSGSADAPIIVSTYGAGNRPRLDGEGKVENVVSLFNQEYITLEGLEITNLHPDYEQSFELNGNTNRSTSLRAVNVSAKNYGIVHSIQIKNLYIHDINGNLAAKWNGGIFFDVQADTAGGVLLGIPTKYDGILIEGCTIEKVDRSAIKLVSSGWANQSLVNSPSLPIHWYPSTNIVVRENRIHQVGGDGITVRDSEGALIEYNLVTDCRYQNTGYNAGIWPFQATKTVVQYNEVARTHGTQDGQGLDCDHLSAYTVMQYNYSHDNQGGFMLIMNGFPHTAPTIRYNISQNDKDKTFEFSRGTPAGTMIYNNTIYSDSLLTGRGGVFDMANSVAGTGNREFYVFNNLFYFPSGQAFYCGEANNTKAKIKLYNNAYYGGISVPAEEGKAITSDPKLTNAGSAPTSNNGNSPFTGKYLSGQLDAYKPLAGSSLINQGLSPQELLVHFGGAATDRRALSPTDLFALSSSGNSVNFTAAGFLPKVANVSYEEDILGTALPVEAATLTIGAIQYTAAPAPPVSYTISLSASPASGGSVAGGGAFVSGSSCTITATASSGYTFVNWTENGGVVSTSSSYSFALSKNRTLMANFKLTPASSPNSSNDTPAPAAASPNNEASSTASSSSSSAPRSSSSQRLAASSSGTSASSSSEKSSTSSSGAAIPVGSLAPSDGALTIDSVMAYPPTLKVGGSVSIQAKDGSLRWDEDLLEGTYDKATGCYTFVALKEGEIKLTYTGDDGKITEISLILTDDATPLTQPAQDKAFPWTFALIGAVVVLASGGTIALLIRRRSRN